MTPDVDRIDTTLDFTGQVVVVTGGARGIGRGITEAFLAAGADVTICGRTEPAPQELPDAGGRRATFLTADVRDAQQAASVLTTTAQRFGRVDVLVNNAGGPPPCPPPTRRRALWLRSSPSTSSPPCTAHKPPTA